jgi:hypothetical protein
MRKIAANVYKAAPMQVSVSGGGAGQGGGATGASRHLEAALALGKCSAPPAGDTVYLSTESNLFFACHISAALQGLEIVSEALQGHHAAGTKVILRLQSVGPRSVYGGQT